MPTIKIRKGSAEVEQEPPLTVKKGFLHLPQPILMSPLQGPIKLKVPCISGIDRFKDSTSSVDLESGRP